MKGSSDFRDALGVSQEEAAMLLGVSRSQFSLFELGKRSLPTTAMVAYVEMWTYVQEQVNKKESEDAHTVLDKEKVKMFIETELAQTLYKQKFLQKKILATRAKFNKAQAALHLVEYLKSKGNSKQDNFSRVLEMNAQKKLEKHGILAQTKLEIELKSVESYYKQLQSWCKNRQ